MLGLKKKKKSFHAGIRQHICRYQYRLIQLRYIGPIISINRYIGHVLHNMYILFKIIRRKTLK